MGRTIKEIFFSLLHSLKSHSIIANVVGMWLSLVERIVRDDEVAGSNPVIPTISKKRKRGFDKMRKRFVKASFFMNVQEIKSEERIPWEASQPCRCSGRICCKFNASSYTLRQQQGHIPAARRRQRDPNRRRPQRPYWKRRGS